VNKYSIYTAYKELKTKEKHPKLPNVIYNFIQAIREKLKLNEKYECINQYKKILDRIVEEKEKSTRFYDTRTICKLTRILNTFMTRKLREQIIPKSEAKL